MCKSLLDNREALQQMVATPNWRSWQNSGSPEFKTKCEFVRSCIMDERGFWAAINELVEVMDPIVSFLKLVDGQKPVMGKIYYKAWKVRVGCMLLLCCVV